MLKGFTLPKSPFGQAALTPPPPWHFAGNVVGVEFWTDPGATAGTLPNGLSPDPNSNGRAVMMFLDWQFTAQDDEYLEPARYQYREESILVDAMYRDVPVMWCPYIYVDNDAALERGWTQGFPKKMGSIFQTRSFAASGPAAAPVVSGSRFGASLSAHGQRLAEACVTLHSLADPERRIWNEVRLSPLLSKIAYWALLSGTYGNWVVTAAAMLGTAALSPITAGGHSAAPGQEALVTTGFGLIGLAIILASSLLLWGLRGNLKALPSWDER
jgi:hypothetical protein